MDQVTLTLPQPDFAALLSAAIRGSAWQKGATTTRPLMQVRAAPGGGAAGRRGEGQAVSAESAPITAPALARSCTRPRRGNGCAL